MATETLLALLAFGTMGALVAFGWRSAASTEQRRRTSARRSTLAADAPNADPDGRRPPDV